MAEVLGWLGDCFRAMVGLLFMLIPGTLFWLVVIGVIAILWRFKQTYLYQIARDKAREIVKPTVWEDD